MFVQAQEQQPVIGLPHLLERVVQFAPSLSADSASINIRQQQLHTTSFNWLPALRLSYQTDIGTNNNLPGGYFGYGMVPTNSRVREAGNSSSILTSIGAAAFEWELYNFGAYDAQRKVAESDVVTEEAKLVQSRYQLQAFTIDQYLQLMRLQDLRFIQEQNISRNGEIRRSVMALAKSGIKAGVDTSIASAELSKARLVQIDINNQIRQIQLQLAALSGMTPESIVADTGIEQHFINYLPEQLNDTISLRHPLLDYYHSLYNNSLYKEALVKKNYNPRIMFNAAAWGRGSSVSASDEFRALAKGWGLERANYLVGLGITYNLFDVKRKQLQLSTQKASTTYALKKLKEQQVVLQLSTDQANRELVTARERLSEIPNQLTAATAAYRQKLSLYKNGLTDIIELNMALNLLYRAEQDYTVAKYNYCKAIFQKAITENQVDQLIDPLK
ncbi:TolC family protein [Filimonas effusa]|uniref:TolC family protein n=1 Tax=Filimonas effusa TaxID=2508721 RepID=A0A4Q1D6V8_9BACT|nr:TolC family protein [Filimonas effusa]RXK83766.1 TolC family protein [Filimonas effusa]